MLTLNSENPDLDCFESRAQHRENHPRNPRHLLNPRFRQYTYRPAGALGGYLGYYTAFYLKTKTKRYTETPLAPSEMQYDNAIANFDTTFAEICVILL